MNIVQHNLKIVTGSSGKCLDNPETQEQVVMRAVPSRIPNFSTVHRFPGVNTGQLFPGPMQDDANVLDYHLPWRCESTATFRFPGQMES